MNPKDYEKHHKSIASVRAGNVIGGGDWALDRIIPDCIRAIEAGLPIRIRNRNAVRPWQHVLEPLSGYMLLAKNMWENPTEYCEGWNFGPRMDAVVPVWDVAGKLVKYYYSDNRYPISDVLVDMTDPNAVHEANLLMLDITKAEERLGWKPRMDIDQCIALTADWYKRYNGESVYGLCIEEMEMYIKKDKRSIF